MGPTPTTALQWTTGLPRGTTSAEETQYAETTATPAKGMVGYTLAPFDSLLFVDFLRLVGLCICVADFIKLTVTLCIIGSFFIGTICPDVSLRWQVTSIGQA